MKILITGATGFVGSNILKALLEENHEVTVIASTHTENPIPSEVKKVCYLGFEGLNWKEAYGKDAVIHQAANNDTLFSDQGEMFRANVFGPIKLFHEAAKGGCKKFIYASSTAVYGSEPAPYKEDNTLVKPLNLYGETKAKFDSFAMRFAQERGFDVIGFRYCNVYGPGEQHKGKRASMIYQIYKQLMENSEVRLFTDGTQRRDWIHVDDVVGANMAALRTSGISGIYNCGSGQSITFNDMAMHIIKNVVRKPDTWDEALANEIKYIPCPFKDTYQDYTECDITKMREELEFSPHYDIESGIEAYIKSLAIL